MDDDRGQHRADPRRRARRLGHTECKANTFSPNSTIDPQTNFQILSQRMPLYDMVPATRRHDLPRPAGSRPGGRKSMSTPVWLSIICVITIS